MVKEGCHLCEHLGLGTRLKVECDVRVGCSGVLAVFYSRGWGGGKNQIWCPHPHPPPPPPPPPE